MSGRHLDSIPPRTVWKRREAVCSLIFPIHKQAAHNGWPIPSLADLSRHGHITSSRFLYLSGDECLPPNDPPPPPGQITMAAHKYLLTQSTSQVLTQPDHLSTACTLRFPVVRCSMKRPVHVHYPGICIFSRFDMTSDAATAPPVVV